ncbi:hypothetical protein F383_35393 [Gossypium arboreum]|uniref:Uncharacterized protein n=1 Tax=Gossypium arboreum TaxID=29729 RepID=A0A0B0N9J8_GOSAR|nr:hypothetical protein F383_35393 [Gossypium arboreum]
MQNLSTPCLGRIFLMFIQVHTFHLFHILVPQIIIFAI